MTRLRIPLLALLLMAIAAPAATAAPEQKMKELAAVCQLGSLVLMGVLSAYVCGLALGLLTVFLAPGVTGRGAAQVQAATFRSFLAGFGAVLVLFLLLHVAHRAPVLAVVIVPALLILGVGGAVSVGQDLGRRAFALAGREGSRLGHLAAGWAVLLVAALIPWVGWILVGPILLCTGIGGFLLALFARAHEAPAAAPAPPPPSA